MSEYELVRAFEGWINKKYPPRRHVNIYLVFIPTSRDALIPDLLAGRGDMAAGILTLTPERLAKVDGGGPFFRGVKELVVTGPESPAVSTLDDLAGQYVVVRRSSSYWSHLEQLNARFASEGKPPIKLEAAPEDLADDDLLEMVNAGLIGITRRGPLRRPPLEQDPAGPARARGGRRQRGRRRRLADSEGQPQAEAGDRRVRQRTRPGHAVGQPARQEVHRVPRAS